MSTTELTDRIKLAIDEADDVLEEIHKTPFEFAQAERYIEQAQEYLGRAYADIVISEHRRKAAPPIGRGIYRGKQ